MTVLPWKDNGPAGSDVLQENTPLQKDKKEEDRRSKYPRAAGIKGQI